MPAATTPSDIEAKGLRRVLRNELKLAAGKAAWRAPHSDASLHDIRKLLKKARAGLRLLRGSLGDREYRRCNTALRDAGRPLTELRDAKVLGISLEQLRVDASPQERRAIGTAQAVLNRDRREARRQFLSKRGNLKRVRRAIQRVRRRLGDFDGEDREWSVAAPGLEGIYRRARDSFSLARSHPTDADLHELRKQAKYLWNALRMVLSSPAPPVLRPLVVGMRRISDLLGEDHDLAVLGETMLRKRGEIPEGAVVRILALTSRRRTRLQAQAIRLARRRLQEEPGVFVQTIEASRS